MSSLTVICPNLRRHPVKVTPGTLLHKVVEEACLKSGYDINCCVAKNQGKIIDLALPFRLSGLPNNATIEVTVTDKVKNKNVELALQLPEGVRQTATFELSSSLKEVLTYFSGTFNQNLLSFEGGAPGCIFMNKKYIGPELEHTSISSMGITGGKILLRYQKVEISQEELSELTANALLEQKRLSSLNLTFNEAKAENEKRKRIEEEREAKFEERRKFQEAEDAKKRDEEAKQTKEENEKAMQVDEPHPISQAIPDRLSDWNVDNGGGWSFDSPFSQRNDPVPVVPQQSENSDRLTQLNSILQRINRSIASGTNENMVNVMADSGRMSLSQIEAATNTIEFEKEPPAQVFDEPSPRNVLLFPRVDSSQPIIGEASTEVSDEFFNLSVDDAKSIQKDLKYQVRMETQRSLVPQSFIKKKNRQLKLEAWKHTVIRFTVGNQLIQVNFNSGEPVSRLFEEVANFFQSQVDFTLAKILNQPVEKSNTKNLIEADLSPNSTLTVKVKENSNPAALLKPEIVKGTHADADKLSKEWLAVNTLFKLFTGLTTEEERVMKRPAQIPQDYESSGNKPSAPTGPKWFKHK